MLPNWLKNLFANNLDQEEGSADMKWIVGLGNPGVQYESTRHNIGFMVIDRLSDRWQIPVQKSKCKGLVGEGRHQGTKVALFKPMTYMNLSGEALRAYMDYYKLNMENLIVVYDDLDTPFGKIRLRYKGSSGGHNGIKSIIQHLGTEQFHRVRMGISRPQRDVSIVDYVLSNYTKAESVDLMAQIDAACDAIEEALTEPFEKVMARHNR